MQVTAGRRPSRMPRDVARRLEAAAERPSLRQRVSFHLWHALSIRIVTMAGGCWLAFGAKHAAVVLLIYYAYVWIMDPHAD